MHIAVIVFNALRTFDRPATRAEIERESGLDYDQVHEALRTLSRHGVLIKFVDGPRRRGLYQLTEDARRIETVRGRYERTAPHRKHLAALARARRADAVATYSPAMAPAHAAAPGALRTVVRGILDRRRQVRKAFEACALAQLWKER